MEKEEKGMPVYLGCDIGDERGDRSVNKVFVIGHSEISVSEIKHKLALSNETEIIFVNNREDIDSILGTDASVMFMPKPEPYMVEAIPRYSQTIFIPKQKHSPKGHERPYKFHR